MKETSEKKKYKMPNGDTIKLGVRGDVMACVKLQLEAMSKVTEIDEDGKIGTFVVLLAALLKVAGDDAVEIPEEAILLQRMNLATMRAEYEKRKK